MRVRSLTLAAASAALLAPTTLSTALPVPPPPPQGSTARRDADVSAADLLSKVRDCSVVSEGRYRTDRGVRATVPVCGERGAVFWKADMDIDCDGRPTGHCNRRTDPFFTAATAYRQSDGRYPSAERLPYIVVPAPSPIWNHRDHGIRGGSLAAVVYRGRVLYAVVGDVGPDDMIGEASYATAKALGIPADPHAGGTAHGVTYIVFKEKPVEPIENRTAAVTAGERLAREFVRGAEALQGQEVVQGRQVVHGERSVHDD